MEYKNYTDLEVYKECRRFRKLVSATIAQYFPDKEKFLLTSQTLDTSRSVTANLAEGHGRFYYQDSIKFCRNSRGSLEETLEHFITAFDEGYVSAEKLKEIKHQYDSCMKLINGYIRYLAKSKRGA